MACYRSTYRLCYMYLWLLSSFTVDISSWKVATDQLKPCVLTQQFLIKYYYQSSWAQYWINVTIQIIHVLHLDKNCLDKITKRYNFIKWIVLNKMYSCLMTCKSKMFRFVRWNENIKVDDNGKNLLKTTVITSNHLWWLDVRSECHSFDAILKSRGLCYHCTKVKF